MNIKSYSKAVIRRLPVIGSYLRQSGLRKRFSVELGLLKGTHHNANQHPSIIHFSLNKAATQYTKSILKRCTSDNGMVPVGIHEYAFNTDFPYLDYLSEMEMQRYQHIFKPTGYLYSVFGGMIEGIPALDKYILILMIRDPRDILVSEYYSIAYSHVVPDKRGDKYDEFMTRRNTARSTTIDEFVVEDSARLYKILDNYKVLLLDRYPHTYVTKYEEMAFDFQRWLNALLDNCQLNITNELLQALLEKNERSRPQGEDIHQHLRKGTPEDYKEKLKGETINFLTTKFSSILDIFGYQR